MNNKTLGQFIAELRKEQNLTQRELSEKLGVSDKTISHWERDESSPDISILPELSGIFGITVDELLRREKKPPVCATVISPQSENSMKEKAKTKKPYSDFTSEEKFHRYKILSLIGTAFGVFALVSVITSGTFLKDFLNYNTALSIPMALPLFSAIRPLIISLIATVGARIYFSATFIPKEENEEATYIYKANRIFTLNLYLLLPTITFGISPVFDIPYISLFCLTALLTAAFILAIDGLLKAKGFLKPKNQKLFRLRLITIIVAFVLIFAGCGVWAYAEVDPPTEKIVSFDNIDDFIAFAETPKPKPEDAWRIDGVEVTYWDNGTTTEKNDDTTPNDNHMIYNPETDEFVSFNLLNGDIYRYTYIPINKTYAVNTYSEQLKVKDFGKVQDTLSMAVPLYSVGVIVLSFIVYMKKAKKLRDEE